jgi:hypothetical protein
LKFLDIASSFRDTNDLDAALTGEPFIAAALFRVVARAVDLDDDILLRQIKISDPDEQMVEPC